MNKNDQFFSSCISTISIVVVGLIIATAMRGWALSLLWGWFIVPLFDAPQLTIVQAIGLSMVISFNHFDQTQKKEKTESFLEDFSRTVFVGSLHTLFVVLLGWIISGLL